MSNNKSRSVVFSIGKRVFGIDPEYRVYILERGNWRLLAELHSIDDAHHCILTTVRSNWKTVPDLAKWAEERKAGK